ncbi:MAG: hypothetical protein HGA77_08305 [Chlorobiaceae bacterium]|nr:hypothetical protein [Chlorobiaceae bacterium]
MGTSRTACSIDLHESAIVRLQASGDREYTLTGCGILPFGLGDISAGKGKRLLKKLAGQLKKFRNENIALCVSPETYLPLPACFAMESTVDEFRISCMMEADNFLDSPENYHCDAVGSTEDADSGIHEKKLLLFYPSEPAKTLAHHLSRERSILFSCSPQLSLLHLSEHTDTPRVILELENSYILLAVARNGRFEKFVCRQVKGREEAVYFTIRELSGNQLANETGVQVTGTLADKAMTELIEQETQVKTRPLGLPSSLKLFNPERFAISSPAAIKAIGTALMALTGNGRLTFLLQ